MRMYVEYGDCPFYITSVGSYNSGVVNQPLLSTGLVDFEKFDEPSLYVFPDAMAVSTATSYYSLINRALMQAQKLKDRFVIIDAFADDSDNIRNTASLGNG